MIKDLTTLKWKKNIYYVSDGIIFDIESKAKKFDIDCCGMYLVDISDKVKDGASVVLEPEAYINNVPYIVAEFISDSERTIKRYFPLQFLIEEGDKVAEGKVIQTHPDVFDNKYINKFNQDIFNTIKKLIRDPFNTKNLDVVKNALPDWLCVSDDRLMTESYIDKQFLKGYHYNQNLAVKGDSTFKVSSIKLGIGENLTSINIWSDEVLQKAIDAISVEMILNKFGGGTISTMELAAQSFKDIKSGSNFIKTFINFDEDIRFESLCAGDDIDTYYEYKKSKDTSKYYSLLNSEESFNALYTEGTGLWMYYQWSDQANAPYKEDLWNTVENRAANINDAKKVDGEYVLDENGNYIYENCVRCWQGAVNAPGAKFPWIVVKYDGLIPSTITFKYNYPDGSVKSVNPWGNKIFGGSEDEPRRIWGVASVASEFEDIDFLLPENRTDGGQSTFELSRFEIVLNPVE